MSAVETTLASLVAQYELAQRNRIASGAYLRAAGACDPTTLGVLHEHERRAELSLARQMGACVVHHATWPWLERVRGIGPVLAARLLARLRIERAATPSSFWMFCGLATVPGERHHCHSCGTALTLVAGSTPPRRHHAPNGTPCATQLTTDRSRVRVAMRHPIRGQRRPFDASARTVCHIIGTSFLRRGGRYRTVYDERRARLAVMHSTWTAMHQHRSALRVMEKLFLAHLWAVWREQLGTVVRKPYGVARRGPAGVLISPWEMVDD